MYLPMIFIVDQCIKNGELEKKLKEEKEEKAEKADSQRRYKKMVKQRPLTQNNYEGE